ncbi:ParH-like protein [Streptomyces sp. NPDC088124]|uniref:ParH-like protein n=1 Tax=Streptomyces sp. NPDC088124 TaxID=3154654 RepID=UPI0034320823
MGDLGRTRRRMRAMVRELDLPRTRTVEELCAAVAERTGRQVRLVPRRMKVGEPSGFVERRAEADIVHFEQETSSLHQAHIICHELAHLLCGHLAEAPTADEEAAEVDLPTLDPDLVRLVLGRSHYDEAAETEAEILGAELTRNLVLAPGAGTTSQLAPAMEHRKGQHL